MKTTHKMLTGAKVANRINLIIRNSDAEYTIDIDEPRDWAGDLQSVIEVAQRRVDYINAKETEMPDFEIRALELEDGHWTYL